MRPAGEFEHSHLSLTSNPNGFGTLTCLNVTLPWNQMVMAARDPGAFQQVKVMFQLAPLRQS